LINNTCISLYLLVL